MPPTKPPSEKKVFAHTFQIGDLVTFHSENGNIFSVYFIVNKQPGAAVCEITMFNIRTTQTLTQKFDNAKGCWSENKITIQRPNEK